MNKYYDLEKNFDPFIGATIIIILGPLVLLMLFWCPCSHDEHNNSNQMLPD